MRVIPSCLGAPLSILVSAAAWAQVPVGPEFRVNTYLTGSQVRPSVGVDGAGNFVVVWATQYPPSDLRGQRFDRFGSPRGTEFVVHASTFQVRDPQVAVDAAGGFTVAWARVRSGGPLDQEDVLARLYDASGDPRGAEFLVNVYTTGSQDAPSIASEASGAFVVVWSSGSSHDGAGAGVFGQRFDAGGNRLGVEFVVPSQTGGNESEPAVAVDGAGNFVVVWRSAFGGGMASSVAGQRFMRDGLRIGGEFQVSALSTSHPHYPALAQAPGGDFMVAWSDNFNLPPKLLARRYDGAGVPRAPESALHVFGSNALWRVAASADAGGRFVLWWYDVRQAPSSGVELLGRRFDAAGGPRGRAFRVSTATAGLQAFPAAAADAAGNLLVAWFHVPPQSAEGDINARRFHALFPHGMNVDPAGGSSSDGNRVLEPGETVEVRPAWRNQTGAALSLAGSLSGITGPPGATYSIVDGAADYGVVAHAATQECLDCYAVAVTAPSVRPALHWDALATEGFEAGEEGHTDWSLHVGRSFADVPRTNPFYRAVETLLHNGITSGCGPDAYCPAASTTREQMATFVLLAKEGAAYVPPGCVTPVFSDVPASSSFCRWVEELARRGVTSGCGGGNYCPTAAVTREQMAVFVLRTLDPALNPPACTTPVFNDVPASSPFCRWIEELARRGVTSGCGGGNYCPTAAVTREQMAVFLAGTFGLRLYGP